MPKTYRVNLLVEIGDRSFEDLIEDYLSGPNGHIYIHRMKVESTERIEHEWPEED